MGKYLLPRLRLVRKFGHLPGMSRKLLKYRCKTPGQHGKFISENNMKSLKDDYLERLREKQRLRFNFGIQEKQMHKYYLLAKKKNCIAKESLLVLLESRLDTLIFRGGFTTTIPSARQIVNHGHVLVNNKKITIPSFNCKQGDIITIRKKSSSKDLIFRLILKTQTSLKALIDRKDKYIMDLLSSRDTDQINEAIRLTKLKVRLGIPNYLKSDFQFPSIKIMSKISADETHIAIDEQKITEYYSK